MSETVESLVLDLLEWLGRGERGYAETMEAWRTSCPRMPVWEIANERGFVANHSIDGRAVVALTESGRRHLGEQRVH